MSVLPKIVWPIPSSRRGSEFKNQEEILSHLGGESTGLYMIGRSGMWHGGIHITEATTPWCALSGKSPLEAIDFPVPFKGELAIRCMADGEVIAYRICRDYLTIAWESGPLNFSGSFVLVKHYIQPGEKETSGLHFYTLYMHLAPYSAYEAKAENQWVVQDTLRAYSEMDWLTAKLTSDETSPQIAGYMPEGARVEWNPADSNLNATGSNKRKYGLVTLKGLPEKNSSTLTPGQRYWVVVDNNNVKPAPGAGPGWWRHLLPPAKEAMVFDKTVSLSSPFAIKAGDPIGHMGYYQAPKDGGYEARYQVHIECTSMDDNLEKFLTNPEQVGKNNPLWLKYAPGLALYKKDAFTGTFTKDARVTTRAGILPLKQVQTEVDKSTKQEYWQLRPENAYVPKDQVEPQLLSQYDLAKLGFRTEIAEPTSFDYLDGKKQPTGFFRSLINSLYEAAIGDTRTSHALVKHNYQRLLDKIDSGSDRYSPMEYWRALHNPDYRDVLQKTIVKHPSDWYFKKDDAIWQPFLNALKKDAPEWKKYSEDFLDKMAWMQDVTTEKLGPSLWHMHPLRFLGSLKEQNLAKIAWGAKVSREFKLKVIEVCERLEINPDYLMSCMAFETGETFSPSVRNPNGSATGLIQFMSSTARALGTTINELASMTSVEQMDYVEKYFKPYTGKIKTIEDVYMVIFCPRAVGKPNSYILYNEGRSYDDNKGLDLNKDNAITKYEAGFKVREKLKLGMKDGYRG